MKKLKILLNTIPVTSPGGVADHFLGLRDKFQNEVIYNYIGGKSRNKFFALNQMADYIKFAMKILSNRPDLIHLNPSLNKKAIIRDALFLLIAKLFNKKIIVFWHGWKISDERLITINYSRLFKFVYNMANAHIVLCTDFKSRLIAWGINTRIYLETTKVDDDLLLNFNIYSKKYNNTILFLARVEKNKGIYLTIDAVNKIPDCSLVVAGTGSELTKAIQYVKDRNINRIKFVGYVSCNEKIDTLMKASIFVLPTWHGEGMPTSVLEAMAFGLPVITRPVGGLKDFFENDKMGYITKSKNPEIIAELINDLIKNKEKMRKIGQYNHEYAKKYFLASKVAGRLEKIYRTTFFQIEKRVNRSGIN